MFKYVVIACVVLVPVCALVIGPRGCSGFFEQESVYVETEDEKFTRGREFAAAGRNTEAMLEFGKIIQAHPDASAESNFEIGLLAFKQGDYPLAIYHFQRFLVLRPDAGTQTRERVVGLIDSSKKRFLQEMLPAGRAAETAPSGISAELETKYRAVMTENEALKREIATLRERLALADERKAQAPASVAPQAAKPAEPAAVSAKVAAAETAKKQVAAAEKPKPAVPATHTVQPGDTLSKISLKYYGTSARWREIYNANRISMGDNPAALKPGMVLKLPRP